MPFVDCTHAGPAVKRPADSQAGPAETQRFRTDDAPLKAAFRSLKLGNIFSNNTYREFHDDTRLLRLLSKETPNFKLIDKYIDMQYKGLEAFKSLNATGTRQFADRIREFEENVTFFCRRNDGTLKKFMIPWNINQMGYLKDIFLVDILREFRAIRLQDGTISVCGEECRDKGRPPTRLPASEVPTFWKVELVRLPTRVLHIWEDTDDFPYELPYLIMPGVYKGTVSGLPVRYVYLPPTVPAEHNRENIRFHSCEFLEHVRLSDNSAPGLLEQKRPKRLEPNMFSGCIRLKYVRIPSDCESISEHCFRGCTSLTKAPMSDSIRMIQFAAFFECTALKTVNLPRTLYHIHPFAFFGCTALKTIRLPIDVDGIGVDAFNDCPNLTILACENSGLFDDGGIEFASMHNYNVRKIKCDEEGKPE